MGCVPSRCLYCTSPSGRNQHQHHHGSRIPLLRSVSSPLRKRRARNSQHQHLVALTSTTYGLLRWNSNNNNNNGSSPSSSPESEIEALKTPIQVKKKQASPSEQCSPESHQTPFFDTSSVINTNHDDCTDKGVVQETPQISSVSSSSSSSCVNKLVTFDSTTRKSPAPQEVFNVNIWEIMAGIDDDSCLGSKGFFGAAATPPCRRRKTPGLSASRQSGKRRLYPRSNSFSTIQAARNLDSILAVDGMSPAALEKLLKEIYQYYVSSRSHNPVPRKPRGFIFGDKENSAPRFDRSPNLSSMRKKKRTSSGSPFRSKVLERSVDKGGFSFSFFTSKVDYEESSRTPLTPLALKGSSSSQPSPSPLFRREKKQASPDPKKTTCCSCSCCCSIDNKSQCQRSGELRSSSTSSTGPLFDPELLASIERAFQSVSAEEWYSGKEDWTTTTATSSEYYSSSNEEVPLMTSFKGRSSSAAKGNKCSGGTSPPNSSPSPAALGGLWDSICSFTGTAKKISFSKVSPLAHHKIDPQALHHEVEEANPLLCFPVRCPPGGDTQVVIYTTSLRGIRKTFEDCHSLQMMLRSLGVCIDERDISMHSEFRLELRRLLEDDEPVTVPRLFIRGRYIGGAEQAKRLHEEGKLVKMLEGIPREDPFSVCDGCGGLRFIPCLECSGSCKLVICQDQHQKSSKGINRQVSRCPDCNENGLIRCPICC